MIYQIGQKVRLRIGGQYGKVVSSDEKYTWVLLDGATMPSDYSTPQLAVVFDTNPNGSGFELAGGGAGGMIDRSMAPRDNSAPVGSKHSHYFKPVEHLSHVDVYRVLELFGVTDHAVGHAVKKLLCAGQRGAKDTRRDIQEARDTLTRRLEMYVEDSNGKV